MTTRSGHGEALRLKAEHDRGLRAIDDYIAAYEAEHGEITDGDMEAAYQWAKARAIVVRGGRVVNDKDANPGPALRLKVARGPSLTTRRAPLSVGS